jgi:hypothetical protein
MVISRGLLIGAIALWLPYQAANAQMQAAANAGGDSPSIRQASINVNLASTSFTIPSNFIGLSGSVGDFVNGFYQGASGTWTSNGVTASASSFLSVFNLLWPSGCLFRLGGSSADTATAPNITSGMASNLNTFIAAMGSSGCSLIYGLDLVANNPTAAASTALTLTGAISPSITTFQFGNEPSLNGFTGSAYISRWNTYYAAVTGSVSGASYAAIDDLVNGNLGVPADIAASLTPGLGGLKYITEHWYPFCKNTVISPNAPALLNAPFVQQQSVNLSGAGNMGYLISQNQVPAFTLRMTETNSICVGGQAGMSDRLMGATWFLELAIILAKNGWSGLNIHNEWNSFVGVYNLVVAQPDQNFLPTPEFYGLYLFSKITGQQIVASSVTGSAPVQAIATKGINGNANIIAVNSDPWLPANVTVDQSSAWTTATLLQVKGSAGCSEANPIIGGQPFGESGSWSGSSSSLARGASILLGPCEAALISIQP